MLIHYHFGCESSKQTLVVVVVAIVVAIVSFLLLLLFVYFFLIYTNRTATLTALQNNGYDSINKIKKNSTKQFFFCEDNFTLVKRPGAQGLVYAIEHFPFQRKFMYIIGCHL